MGERGSGQLLLSLDTEMKKKKNSKVFGQPPYGAERFARYRNGTQTRTPDVSPVSDALTQLHYAVFSDDKQTH